MWLTASFQADNLDQKGLGSECIGLYETSIGGTILLDL